MSGSPPCASLKEFEGSCEAGSHRSQSAFPSRRLLDLRIIADTQRLCPLPAPKLPKAIVASEQIDAIPSLYIPLLDVPFKYFLKSTVELLEIIKKKLQAESLFTFNSPMKPLESM